MTGREAALSGLQGGKGPGLREKCAWEENSHREEKGSEMEKTGSNVTT